MIGVSCEERGVVVGWGVESVGVSYVARAGLGEFVLSIVGAPPNFGGNEDVEFVFMHLGR